VDEVSTFSQMEMFFQELVTSGSSSN
jgi:hypothetical protein